MRSVFWLFWLSYQYLPSDWLERILWGSLIVARGSSPESPGQRVHMIFLVYSIASLFYYVLVLSPAPTWHFPTVMAWYNLFVLKVPLNPNKQTSKQHFTKPGFVHVCRYYRCRFVAVVRSEFTEAQAQTFSQNVAKAQNRRCCRRLVVFCRRLISRQHLTRPDTHTIRPTDDRLSAVTCGVVTKFKTAPEMLSHVVSCFFFGGGEVLNSEYWSRWTRASPWFFTGRPRSRAGVGFLGKGQPPPPADQLGGLGARCELS